METRPFGKTGASLPILSFGAQRIVDEEGCNEDQALEILNTALDRGIRYFDTAWVYSRGQSEQRVGMVAAHRREEMWIATKTIDTNRDGARRQLEESLTRLQTDYVDEWRLHNVWDFERLDQMTARGGALEAAIQAREEGLVRFISISGHTDPQVQIEALRRFPFDTALVAVSVLDHFIYSFAHEFLPVVARLEVGVVGMKVFGYKKLAHVADRALRYSLTLPLTTVIAGCSTLAELEADLAVAENFTPMTGQEQLAFFREVLPLVTPQNMPWKAEDWSNPTEWKPRQEPSGPALWQIPNTE
jgi:aryl-alcohol dehydrogenase-like predicted oxidoreductase